MNWLALRAFRRAWIPLGLIIAAALSLGFAAPANAANPKEVISASFDPATGVLTVSGDDLNNNITISRDAAGAILVNTGAVAIKGGTSTVGNTSLIQVFGRGGNDQLSLDEANGALPKANMSGGAGNDTLTGGSGDDQLSGEADNDILLGKAGNDILAGGDGNDVVDGGAGDDQAMGEAGNDKIVWNAGDGSDKSEGGDGKDTIEINGGNDAESFTATPNGPRVRFDRTNPNPSTLDIGSAEMLVLNMNGGDDRFAAGADVDQLIAITVDGGAATDTPGIAATFASIESFPSAVTGTTSAGILSVFGDALDNTITISRDAAGKILVNGGAVAIVGGTATVANTSLIQVFGLGGNDTIALNEANGALPRANLFGGSGNDILTGGSGGDMIFGQSGNDTLLGKGGIDLLFGGADNDVLTGGDGDDQAFGESGNDRMVWNPGDDTDLNEGGDGSDTVEVNGGNAAEIFTVTPNGTRVRFDRVDPAPFSLDIGTSENLVLNANGGDDSFSASNGLATLIQITVDGGAGNDTLTGGDGNDLLLGGDGNDLVTGGRGNDVALLGAGDDTFQWNPGDGSDTVEGQDGSDTLLFNGANIAENINISANGGRVRFTRDVASIVMDINDVERVDFNARGGADTIAVNDLTGTAVTEVNLDLSSVPGSGTGDALPDTVIVNGTNGDDVIQVIGDASGTSAVGLAAQVNITGAEAANDRLTINALAGDDVVEASGLAAGAIQLVADGGDGNDVLIGGAGNDVLAGGDGDNILIQD